MKKTLLISSLALAMGVGSASAYQKVSADSAQAKPAVPAVAPAVGVNLATPQGWTALMSSAPSTQFNPVTYAQFMDPAFYMQFANPTVMATWMNPASYYGFMNPALYSHMASNQVTGMMNPQAYAPMMNPANYSVFMNPATYMKWTNPVAYSIPASSAEGTAAFNPFAWMSAWTYPQPQVAETK